MIPLEVAVALSSVAGMVIALVALVLELRNQRFSMGVDLILRLAEQYDSKEMRKRRKSAAGSLRDEKPNQQLDDVLNFFEMVAYLVKKQAISPNLVWHKFDYWIRGWWFSSLDYIRRTQKEDPSMWKDLAELRETVSKIDSKESGSSVSGTILSGDKIRDFLGQEMAMDSDSTTSE